MTFLLNPSLVRQRLLAALIWSTACFAVSHANAAGLAVGSSGQPSADMGIVVPPGVAGMTPLLGLEYSEGASNGIAGVGWTVQGISVIARCPASRPVDGKAKGVTFTGSDKLCLNGQRLIQTGPDGVPSLKAQQVNDALGLAGSGCREFRTEMDSFSRIRGCSTAGASADNGPGYFKVWTKSGQVLEFGTNPGGNANAQVQALGRTVVAVWAVSRISDVVGNTIDFKYDQRTVNWGTGPVSGSPTGGLEWGLSEIQYAGNKVVLQYEDRTDATIADTSEAYHGGSKTVARQRIKSISTYVNSPNTTVRGPAATAVAVRTYKFSYTTSAISGRSLLAQWQECAGGPNSNKCLPATTFSYAPGRNEHLAISDTFKTSPLATKRLTSTDGSYGSLVADFNGDGRSDILSWSASPVQNELWTSNGDGTFTKVSSTAGGGLFNLTDQTLFTTDGCWSSVVLDINGDGLPDIVRLPATLTNTGTNCNIAQQGHFFFNRGNGEFTSSVIMGRASPNAVPQAIALNRIKSQKITQSYCGDIAALDSDPQFMAQLVNVVVTNCRTGYGWTQGASYYFIDVNGDGKLDIVTSNLDALQAEDPAIGGLDQLISQVSCQGCTKVYVAQPDGTYLLTLSNLDNVAVYSDPGQGNNLAGFKAVMDADLDGLPDLVSVGTPLKTQTWASNGDLTFKSITAPDGCDVMVDFNGDSKADCLKPDATTSTSYLAVSTGSNTYSPVANFNLGGANLGLSSNYALAGGANFGVMVADLNGDRRHDLIRWHDNPLQNVLLLSNGDGSFRVSSLVPNYLATVKLKHSSGAYDMILGDFTGKGFTEILRVSDVASPQVGDPDKNLLLVSDSTANPEEELDSLVKITSASGLSTSLIRQRLTTANGGRYRSDRVLPVPLAATDTKVEMITAMPVVVTQESQIGIGSSTVKTEYAYRGLKLDTAGRGMLGFRETRQQGQGANGELMTSVSQFSQDFPYIGMPLLTRSYKGALLDDTALPLTLSTVVYCDTSSASPLPTALVGTVVPPCLTYTATDASGNPRPVIFRPYARQKKELAWDLNRNAASSELSTTTSTFSYDSFGNALSISTDTTGTSMGVLQTNTQTTSNAYFPANTAGDNWILGRLQQATVTNTVPNAMQTTTYGSAPNAGDRVGTGPKPAPAPLSAAALAVILQLLMDD